MLEAQDLGAPDAEGNKLEVPAIHVSSGASASSPGASLRHSATTATEDEDESEDESDILEESPCGRWQKRREEVRTAHGAVTGSMRSHY